MPVWVLMERVFQCHMDNWVSITPFLLILCLSFSCSGTFFQAQLPSALAAGAKLRVKVETVYSHILTPFPTHITQAERQLVVFQGNHYLYSPYPTRSQTTRVRLASKTVESYTKLGNPSKNEEVIEYGPFKDVPAFSQVNRMRWSISCLLLYLVVSCFFGSGERM